MRLPLFALLLPLAFGATWSCAGAGEAPPDEVGAGAQGEAQGEGSDVSGGGGTAGELGGAQGDPEGGGGPPAPPSEPPPAQPPPATLHRLTDLQLRNSLLDLVGVIDPPVGDLEPDTSLHGFTSVGATELTVSPVGAERYEDMALRAGRAVDLDCDPGDEACLGEALGRFARRAWRRPPTAEEVEGLVATARSVEAALPGQGTAYALAGVFASPHFLFRVERGEPDPASPPGSGRLRYTDWEMAGRLSYALWQSTPDELLLDAASRGELTEEAGLRAQAERLLASPRARAGLARFFEEHLTLDRLPSMGKDRTLFPQMSETLAAAMGREVLAVVEWLAFEEDGDALELLTTPTTFVDGELAALYGMASPGPGGPHRVDREPASARAGLLGMAAMLALNSHPAATSPTLRGRFVQQNLRCVDVPPPPPGVVTNLDARGEGGVPLTVREKLEAHRADPACAGCHSVMDPIGLGLESFDAIGAYRTTEAGRPVDARSEMAGRVFEGPAELGALLREDPKVTACLARRYFRHVTGRLEGPGQARTIAALVERFEGAGRRLSALMLDTVLSAGFRQASAAAEESP